MRSYSALVVVCVLVLAVILTGCPKPPAPVTPPPAGPQAQTPAAKMPTGEPIVIGAILSVTGPGAPLGEPEKATAEAVATEINAGGGISGRPVKLVVEDDASEEAKAVMAAKKLIEQDKAVAIIGPTLSGTTLAIVDTCEQAQIPLISCAASIKITTPVKKFVFSTAQNDVLAVQRILTYLQPQKLTKVAIICDSNAFGQSGAEQLKKQLPAAGVQIVDEEKFNSKDTDTTAQLTKIKAKSPQAIICWGTNPAPAIVAKNAQALGFKVPVIMSHGVANKKFIELAGPAAEGIIFPCGKIMVADQLAASDPQKTVVVAYSRMCQEKFQKPATTFGGHAWDAMHLLREAIGKVGTDRAKLRDAIETTSKYVGIGGVFNFSATDHNGLTKDCFTLVQIKGGQWTEIK
jgi:branched-chain amino acid transport system substrate-binding protein